MDQRPEILEITCETIHIYQDIVWLSGGYQVPKIKADPYYKDKKFEIRVIANNSDEDYQRMLVKGMATVTERLGMEDAALELRFEGPIYMVADAAGDAKLW